MTENLKDLARRAVTYFIEKRVTDFARVAKLVAQDYRIQECIKRELLEIARGEQSYEEIRMREGALNVMAILGLTKSPEVHQELCSLFTAAFDKQELQELATFEAFSKEKHCGLLCSKMKFLKSLVRALFHVKEERGLNIGRQVAEIFADTRFGRKVAQLLTNAK